MLLQKAVVLGQTHTHEVLLVEEVDLSPAGDWYCST